MKEKLSILTELIKLAKADNKFRDKEFNFLVAISDKLGVSRSEFEKLFDEHIEFTPPESEFARKLQFHRLVLLMNVDGEADIREIDYLKDLGVRMGLNTDAMNMVLEEMNNYPDKIIPPKELIRIFTRYYN